MIAIEKEYKSRKTKITFHSKLKEESKIRETNNKQRQKHFYNVKVKDRIYNREKNNREKDKT